MKTSAAKKQVSTPQVLVNFNPTETELTNNPLYYPIDLLVAQNGFSNENIMKKRSENVLFWDWTILKVGSIHIPAPIHTSSESHCTLYNWNDQPVDLSYNECACVTAIYYLDMLMGLANRWPTVSKQIHPLFSYQMQKGIDWLSMLTPQQYRDIVFALKSQLSDDGHYVLS